VKIISGASLPTGMNNGTRTAALLRPLLATLALLPLRSSTTRALLVGESMFLNLPLDSSPRHILTANT